MNNYFEPLLGVLLLVPVFYLAIPLVILGQQKFPAHPPLLELDFKSLKPDVADFLMRRSNELFTLGFDEPTLIRIPDPAPSVTAFLVMVINRATGDKAMATALVGESSVSSLQTCYLEFSTRFADGRVADTLNTSELSALPVEPETVRTQTPSVTDTRELFELHRYVMNEHGLRGKPVTYEPGQAREYLLKFAFEKAYGDAAKRGWLRYREAEDTYRPTLKGAYLMTWGLLHPFKLFRLMAMRSKERQVLAAFRQQRG
jgi:hypothetical protein